MRSKEERTFHITCKRLRRKEYLTCFPTSLIIKLDLHGLRDSIFSCFDIPMLNQEDSFVFSETSSSDTSSSSSARSSTSIPSTPSHPRTFSLYDGCREEFAFGSR